MDIATKLKEEIKGDRQFMYQNLYEFKVLFSLYEPENEELHNNRALNRLFSHNLKEKAL